MLNVKCEAIEPDGIFHFSLITFHLQNPSKILKIPDWNLYFVNCTLYLTRFFISSLFFHPGYRFHAVVRWKADDL